MMRSSALSLAVAYVALGIVSLVLFAAPAVGVQFAPEFVAALDRDPSHEPRRGIALDAGTGDGRLLDVLGPVYERVVAVDRSGAQLARARERVMARGFTHVTLVEGELDSKELRRALGSAGADAGFASRVLHHAPQPEKVVAQLASLCAPGGAPAGAAFGGGDWATAACRRKKAAKAAA